MKRATPHVVFSDYVEIGSTSLAETMDLFYNHVTQGGQDANNATLMATRSYLAALDNGVLSMRDIT